MFASLRVDPRLTQELTRVVEFLLVTGLGYLAGRAPWVPRVILAALVLAPLLVVASSEPHYSGLGRRALSYTFWFAFFLLIGRDARFFATPARWVSKSSLTTFFIKSSPSKASLA